MLDWMPRRAGVRAAASYELRHVSVGPCDAIEPIKSLTAARRPPRLQPLVEFGSVSHPRRGMAAELVRARHCGKSIGLRAVHQIDPSHRQVRPLCQLAHNPYEFWRALLVNLPGPVHR